MRNPLKRLADTDRPKIPLRERVAAAKGRLVAVKEKYGRTLRVHRALNAPAVVPEPVDRAALVNYATFLWYERQSVCNELYPHLGRRAADFVRSMNEAWGFFHDGNDSTTPRKGMPPASTRAVRVLDLAGVDWRKDLARITLANEDSSYRDNGDRPRLPFGWPTLDAELTEALDDLTRLDAAIEGLYSGDPHRDGDTVPGYDALNAERDATLSRLAKVRARGMPGLQAKAHALLTPGVQGVYEEIDKIAESLARDLVGARAGVLDQLRADPIFAAIEDVKRLEAEFDAQEAALPPGVDVPPEFTAAVWDCVNERLLKTVPTTAGGCQALAAFVPGFFARCGAALSEEVSANLFRLIARSPMRH